MSRVELAPGLAVAVYTPDGTYSRAFGFADLESGARASADTAFYIASSTKPLTALALAALQARGELDLDQTLATFAPDAPFPAAVRPSEVQLRQLLTHTHGIENAPLGFRLAFTGQHDPETLWRLLASSSVNEDAPLGTFAYTNEGYNIATVLTDRRLALPWHELLQREIFTPARMSRASARMSRARGGNWSVARPHGLAGNGAMGPIYLEKTDQTMQSAGGVIMSANDAVRWLELMCEDGRIDARQIVPAEAVAASRIPRAEVNANFNGYERRHYGLGWYIGPHRDEQMLHHFGGFAGFRAHVSYIPARRTGVAVFLNEDSVTADMVDAIANLIYDRTAGRSDAQARFDAALDDVVADRDRQIARAAADRAARAEREWLLTRPIDAYAGVYENQTWGRIEVEASASGLAVSYGVLHAVAEPFTRPDSIRLELVPGMGVPMLFIGEGPSPQALVFRGQSFARL
jgi:CubicO group peptidase (beta-lactamase class C family)